MVELYGPSPVPHYAYLAEGEVDTAFLRDYFGIWVLPLVTYDGLPDRLEALADRIHGHRACQTGWELGPTTATPTPAQRVAGGRLNVRRSRLLATPDEHRCIVISGGGT